MTTETGPYLVCSIDPGGTADPAAIVVAKINRTEHMTKIKVLHLDTLKPTVTPMAHVTFAQNTMAKAMATSGTALRGS